MNVLIVVNDFWDKHISRATVLAAKADGTSELLTFYGHLLGAQKHVYELLSGSQGHTSGELEKDLPLLRGAIPAFLQTVKTVGSVILANEAQRWLTADSDELDELLLSHWKAPTDTQFFAKSLLQPYARWLADSGTNPVNRDLKPNGETHCPYCGGNPQVSFLQSREASSESGNRDLICALCLSVWSFRRVICAKCEEERPAKLGYFHTPDYDHIRIEACDTCKHYIKGVDLTRVGFAVPLVDEVAAAPLDLWAQEHGYTKIELNLVGL